MAGDQPNHAILSGLFVSCVRSSLGYPLGYIYFAPPGLGEQVKANRFSKATTNTSAEPLPVAR